MNDTVRVLRPLGECSVGELLAVQIGGSMIEGVIQFLARAPQGGWILTFASERGTWEIYAAGGECSLVSQITPEHWEIEGTSTVADTTTGGRARRAISPGAAWR